MQKTQTYQLHNPKLYIFISVDTEIIGSSEDSNRAPNLFSIDHFIATLNLYYHAVIPYITISQCHMLSALIEIPLACITTNTLAYTQLFLSEFTTASIDHIDSLRNVIKENLQYYADTPHELLLHRACIQETL